MQLTEERLRCVVAEKIKLSAAKCVTKVNLVNCSDVASYADYLADCLILQLNSYVAGARIHREEHSTQIPASWWQLFKDTYFPLWAKRLWPTITRSIKVLTVTQYLLLPSIKVTKDQDRYEVYAADTWTNSGA